MLLIWLDWTPLPASALIEVRTSIREDFNGIGMGHHREDLRKRLDHVLEQLAQEPGYLGGHHSDLYVLNKDIEIARDQCRMFKQVLLEVDRGAMKILTSTPSRLIILFDLLTSVTHRIPLDIHV